MKDIIVAYPSKKTALHLAGLLEEGGVSVSHVCALGASVLQIAPKSWPSACLLGSTCWPSAWAQTA